MMARMPYFAADDAAARRFTRVVNSLRLPMIVVVTLLCMSFVSGFPLQLLSSGDSSLTQMTLLKQSRTPHGPISSNDTAGSSKRQEMAPPSTSSSATLPSRRHALSVFTTSMLGIMTIVGSSPAPSFAVADCFQDCVKNCKKIAPKDPDYCLNSCQEYCEQEDRTDGLSGSVSAESGEVGLLGGTFGQGTVPKGEDRVGVIYSISILAALYHEDVGTRRTVG
jgi:hypothetical protein